MFPWFQDFNIQIGNVVGDVFVSAACVAYYVFVNTMFPWFQDFNIQIGNVVGDVFVSAACVAYYGAFTSLYRKELVGHWVERCKELEIPVTEGMTLTSVLADSFQIRQWNTEGLPRDQVGRGERCVWVRGEL